MLLFYLELPYLVPRAEFLDYLDLFLLARLATSCLWSFSGSILESNLSLKRSSNESGGVPPMVFRLEAGRDFRVGFILA